MRRRRPETARENVINRGQWSCGFESHNFSPGGDSYNPSVARQQRDAPLRSSEVSSARWSASGFVPRISRNRHFIFIFFHPSLHSLSVVFHLALSATIDFAIFFFALIGLVASFIHPLFPFPSLEGLSHRLSILPLMTPLLPERGGRGDSILPHSLDAPHGRKVYKQRIYTQKNNLSDRHLQISSHLV